MKKRDYLVALICLVALLVTPTIATELPKGYPQTQKTKTLINADWKFRLGDPDADYYKTATADDDWEQVSVPHIFELLDISLNDSPDDMSQLTLMRDVGWYRKDIFIANGSTRVYLDFEGVHQITTLWVNGVQVGVHSVGGYTPFYFDITEYVKRGAKNQITVLADNRVSEVAPPDPGNCDYVRCGGIYRDLYLVERSAMHITSNLDSSTSGVTITTPSVDCANGNATIAIHTEVRNQSKKMQSATLVQRVVDADGEVVLKLSESAEIAAGDRYRFAQIGGIADDVKFWGIDNPYLYKVNTTLYDGDGVALDVVDNRLGIRKVEYDPESGFRLNGKDIELVGFNRHQHCNYIGEAMSNSLHYRDVAQLKELGLNCIRTAHYPHDDELIKACDELGLLVYEEPPTWVSISKNPEWYANQVKAIQAMIRNHKNSPSVIIWGAGINHRGAVAESQFAVKLEDPTRFTGSQNSRWTADQNSSWTDIYGNMNYAAFIWGREEPVLAMEGGYGPEALAPYFRDPMMAGMISWTAHDYYTLGYFETDEYRSKSGLLRSTRGVMDGLRYPKEDELYWYPSQMKSEPYIHVKDAWEPTLKMLTIYSNATQIELEVNGESIGRYLPSTEAKYNGLTHAPFEIKNPKYEDGELKVIAYRDGGIIAEQSVYTPTEATKLNLVTLDYGVGFYADGNDAMAVHAEVLDKNGMRIRDYRGKVTFSVSGDASIVGDEIGEGFNPIVVVNGVASVLVRGGKSAGDIVVSAKCDGLSSSSMTLTTLPAQTNMLVAEAYPIKDRQSVMVDLGGDTQLTQFGWTPWDGNDQDNGSEISATILLATLGNFVAGVTPASMDRSLIVDDNTDGAYKFTIKCGSSDGVLRWLGEANIYGKNNFVYGDGVVGAGADGVILEIEGLPAGEYELRSFHHIARANKVAEELSVGALKSASIGDIANAKVITISVNGELQTEGLSVTEGKEMQYDEPTSASSSFTVDSDGGGVEIRFKSGDDLSGVWLNGFELIRYL
ncbi:MAG: glycoside hydrolase family 2 TIM barrel-domain containing protein [Rikenellaceae bacterium]